MWVLVVNGLVYLGLHLSARRVARPRSAPRHRARRVGDGAVLPHRAKGPSAPGQAQRAAAARRTSRCRSSASMAVVTGIAIWKPVQLAPLTTLARRIRVGALLALLAMLLLVALTFGHIFMVFAVDPYSIRSMITGGYRRGSVARGAKRAPVRPPAAGHEHADGTPTRPRPDASRGMSDSLPRPPRRPSHLAERSPSTGAAFSSPAAGR